MIIQGKYVYLKLTDEYSAELYDVQSGQLICMADKETCLQLFRQLNGGF